MELRNAANPISGQFARPDSQRKQRVFLCELGLFVQSLYTILRFQRPVGQSLSRGCPGFARFYETKPISFSTSVRPLGRTRLVLSIRIQMWLIRPELLL